ncbi:TPA: hypothetical protein N0F65_003573 [Lagenidium giganteum]|uniref:Prolyl 4-hydroxylase alpha subunit domain-containing protein n=1 Tax=Lagenidium giganteum TaxID=4803 RepID=A0AAV2Z5J6_9STRA|nr:TPA: hypothetical protein N0F65_003573 [Lagenidium giganteum]
MAGGRQFGIAMAKAKTKQEAGSTSPKAGGSSPKANAKANTSSSSFMWSAAVVVVALAFGVGRLSSQVPVPDALASLTSGESRVLSTSKAPTPAPTPQSILDIVEDPATLPDKYTSYVVDMEVRSFAVNECEDSAFAPSLLHDGKLVHVTEPMEAATMGDDRVFFMLNGQNEGLYVSWNGQFGCLALAAERAAQWLGADQDVLANGVRLYSQMGEPVRDAQELAATRNIVHILLDFQIWVWPGIKKGYKYTLDHGITLTTVGMSPKVYDVEHFLTGEEAAKIMEYGKPGLDRSKVDGANSSTVVSSARTSHTAFLDDSHFTREFRARSARVARLPSPSFAERLQLVRYAAGEFYRQHLDTFHSREFVPASWDAYTMDSYKQWCQWAAEKLDSLDQSRVPEEFRQGGTLYPNAEDTKDFPNALLTVFQQHMIESNLYEAFEDQAWNTWLQGNLDKTADGILPSIMKEDGKPNYLPIIIKAWERKLGLPDVHYTLPKAQVHGVSHYFGWIRWAKERIAFLGEQVPEIARTGGELYPKFSVSFQDQLLRILLEDYSTELLTRLTNAEWVAWMNENVGHNNVLYQVIETFPHFTETAIKAWESRVNLPALRYKMPKYVKHYNPQRFVTLFLYLNNETKIGGETVFPHSLDRFTDEKIERRGMDECSTGLAVPPRGLHASLFYVQTPEGDIDYMSRHGGCPPHEGIKWGSNSFMWNADADEGADLWTTK